MELISIIKRLKSETLQVLDNVPTETIMHQQANSLGRYFCIISFPLLFIGFYRYNPTDYRKTQVPFVSGDFLQLKIFTYKFMVTLELL